MTDDIKHLVKLVAFPTEVGAAPVVSALQEAGVSAIATGGFTAEFMAEAPGEVQVLVAERDLPKAKEILNVLKEEMDHIDWSQVDVGQPEP
jgi:pheromone shutdown protein TraB